MLRRTRRRWREERSVGPVPEREDEEMLLTSNDYRDLAIRVRSLVEDNDIAFHRGDVVRLFTMLGPLHEGLSVCALNREARLCSTYIKHLVSLWNVTVDDDIDRCASAAEIGCSVRYLTRLLDGGCVATKRHGSAAEVVLSAAFAELEKFAPLDRWRHVVFDIFKQAIGFEYEWFANHYGMASSVEYSVLSTLTTDISVYIDIDFIVEGDVMRDAAYSNLRSACLEFSRAIKYASDIGSFDREVLEEENHNFITICAHEMSCSVSSDDVEGRNAMLKANVIRLAHEHVASGKKWLHGISHSRYDASSLLKTIDGVVATYLGGDPFFQRG